MAGLTLSMDGRLDSAAMTRAWALAGTLIPRVLILARSIAVLPPVLAMAASFSTPLVELLNLMLIGALVLSWTRSGTSLDVGVAVIVPAVGTSPVGVAAAAVEVERA